MLTCKKCGKDFAFWVVIDGKKRSLCKRKFCLDCSPFGQHNTQDLTKPDTDLYPSYKQCKVCLRVLPISEFYKRPDRKNGTLSLCKNCHNKYTVARAKMVKQQAVDYKGGKCVVCGYSRCIDALDFHHIDPQNKDFTFGLKRYRSFKNLLPELDKCILVCTNCHREIHYGFIPAPNIG